MYEIKESTPQNKFLETLIHLLKGNLGAGLFAMGDAFKNSGLVLGIFGVLIIGGICIYNNHLLVRLSRKVKELKDLPKYPTFPETISYSYELGPPWAFSLRNVVMCFMKFCIVFTQLGFCVIYITFVSRSFMKMVKSNWDYNWNVRYYMVASFPIVMIISLIHTLKFLAPISAISMVFIVYGYLVSVYKCSTGLPDISTVEAVSSPWQWPLFVGTVIFTFEGIALIIPLKNEMKKPDKFDSLLGVLNIGMTICVTMLISFGFLSYWKFGKAVSGSVTFDLPATWLAESARICVGLGILMTYPIQFYVAVKVFLKDMKKKWGPFKHPLMVELLLRTLLVIVTYIVALVIPHVNLLLSFIGAFCSNALALFFPATADIALRLRPKTEEEKEKQGPHIGSGFRYFMDIITILLSIFGAIFGVYIALKDIILEIKREIEGNVPRDDY